MDYLLRFIHDLLRGGIRRKTMEVTMGREKENNENEVNLVVLSSQEN